jgi:hypothetical protein
VASSSSMSKMYMGLLGWELVFFFSYLSLFKTSSSNVSGRYNASVWVSFKILGWWKWINAIVRVVRDMGSNCWCKSCMCFFPRPCKKLWKWEDYILQLGFHHWNFTFECKLGKRGSCHASRTIIGEMIANSTMGKGPNHGDHRFNPTFLREQL